MNNDHHLSTQEMRGFLSGFLDRIELSKVKKHLATCSSCSRIVHLMALGYEEKGWEIAEEGKGYMSEHFSHATLEKYGLSQHLLTEEEKQLIKEHLEQCEGCRMRLEMACCDVPCAK